MEDFKEEQQSSCIRQLALSNAAVSQEQSIPSLQKLHGSSPVRVTKSHGLAKAVTKCLQVAHSLSCLPLNKAVVQLILALSPGLVCCTRLVWNSCCSPACSHQLQERSSPASQTGYMEQLLIAYPDQAGFLAAVQSAWESGKIEVWLVAEETMNQSCPHPQV